MPIVWRITPEVRSSCCPLLQQVAVKKSIRSTATRTTTRATVGHNTEAVDSFTETKTKKRKRLASIYTAFMLRKLITPLEFVMSYVSAWRKYGDIMMKMWFDMHIQ